MRDRRQTIIGSLAVCFLIMASSFQAILTPVAIANGYMGSKDNQPSATAVAHAGGEFRIVAANLLWLNVVDHYHHQFMRSGGDFAKNVALLPLIRMITWLDPHFTEAYDVGGLILAETKHTDECRKFLIEGIHNNENCWQLNYDVAMSYAWYDKDYKKALPYAERARKVATDGFDKHRLALLCHTLQNYSPPKLGTPTAHAPEVAAAE